MTNIESSQRQKFQGISCFLFEKNYFPYLFDYPFVIKFSYTLIIYIVSLDFSSCFTVLFVRSLSRVQLFTNPWTTALQISLSSTISQSLFKFTSPESVTLSNHLFSSVHRLPPLVFLPSSSVSHCPDLCCQARSPSVQTSASQAWICDFPRP